MLDVNECGQSTCLLCLGNHRQSQRRFTRRLVPVDLNNPTAGKTVDTQSLINQKVSRGDHADVNLVVATHAQDRSFAVILLNLLNRQVEVASASVCELAVTSGGFGGCFGHG